MIRAPRSRRLALVASCAILGLGLAACGSADEAASPASVAGTGTAAPAASPAVIVLQSPLGGARSESSASPAAADSSGFADSDTFAEGEPGSKMMVADVDYVYDGAVPDLPTEGTAWRFTTGAAPTAEQAAAVAAALGVAGDPVQLSEDQGGGWLVGPADYSAPTVNLSSDAMHSWWYSAGPTDAAPMCDDVLVDEDVVDEAPVTAVAPDAAVSDPTGATETGVTAAEATAADEAKPEPAVIEPAAPLPCAELQPPSDLPDEATARRAHHDPPADRRPRPRRVRARGDHRRVVHQRRARPSCSTACAPTSPRTRPTARTPRCCGPAAPSPARSVATCTR